MSSNDWEQRKLGDLVDRVTRKNQDLVSELPLTISAQYGLIDQNEFFDKRVASKDVSGYYLIENGEFAYNKSTSTDAPWGAIKRLDRYENGVLSTLYIVFGIKENNPVYSDFLVSYYSTNLWHKGIHEIAAEGARNHGLLNIAPADFFETKLKIPQDIEEQKKIGKYFEELERLITLHHRKSNIFIREWDFVWEQRKLGEVIEGVSKKNTDGLYTQDDILACSLGTELDRKTIFYGLRSTEDSVKSYRIVNIGNVIYTKSPIKGYPNGIVRTCKIVDGIVPSLYCVYKKKENISIPIDTRFIQSYLEDKGRLAQYLCPLVNVGARNNVNITDKEFLEGVIKIPMTVEEQTKIVDALEKINHLITLHHRKCEETKILKKYMLQKMFPQNGNSVPEIRFWGFTEDWEQRKLGDMAEFSKGSGYSKGDLIESGTPIILYGRLYTKYETIISDVDTFVEAKDGSVYSKGGEVIVPASGETAEDIARAASVDKSGILLGGDLNVVMPNEDINSAFLAISISNGSLQRELARKAQGKSVVHIHNEEIRNLIVPFPTKAEQNKMENYFAALDHFITLHQKKCDELQNIKKFMLQNMFI